MKPKVTKESNESINKLSVRRINTFFANAFPCPIYGGEKIFSFPNRPERLIHLHMQGVVPDNHREPCPQGSEVLKSMPWNLPMLKDPGATPRGVLSLVLMTVKLGGRYVFLNPRIHPVQWRAYIHKDAWGRGGETGGHSRYSPSSPFLRQLLPLEVAWSEISVLICISFKWSLICLNAFTHTLN